MLRALRQRLLGTSKSNTRRKAPHASSSRRLNFEALECRELLTASSNLFNAVSDGSFEVPVLPANTYQYAPAGSSWQFTGGSGVSGNGTAFTAANPNAPDGTQVAFLQTSSRMSQSITLSAGVYNLTLQAAQRAGDKYSQEIQVLIDGAQVGLITPNGIGYSTYQTTNFSATAGTHTLTFVGLNPQGGDNTAFIDEVAITQATSLADSSFETPSLAAGSYQYAPNGSAWQFTATAGISSNGSGFTSGNPNAPDGSQVAVLQSSGSMSQAVYLSAGTYAFALQAAQRAGQVHSQEIEVLVDGNAVGTVTPTGIGYGSYQTPDFTVTAGMHTVEFLGLNPQGGDNTAFVDEVAITNGNLVSDGSFESPGLVANTSQYAPSGSSWQFSATAGIASNGSPFTAGNPNAPDGTQVALLEQAGTISQSVDLSAGTYNVSFMAAQRAVQAQNQQIEVLIDNTKVGTATPAGTTFGSYQMSFTVAAGTHTLEFLGLNPLGGDSTALIDQVSLTAANSVSDGSFETPGLVAATYQYGPNGSPWLFNGESGVSSNASGFTAGNPSAPDGTQVAFLQSNSNMSQTVSLSAGTYTLSLQAAQRAGQVHYQAIQVLLDGTQIGTIIPSSTAYNSYQMSFVATGGLHTLQFVGLNPLGGDNTAFLDEVSITTANSIGDGSFESPGLAANTYQYTPDGSPWTFLGTAGVSSNGSVFTSGNPNAPDGTQVALLEESGSISQAATFNAGTYTLSLQAAQRANQPAYQEIQVLVDGAQVGLITPGSTNYGSYQTPSFTVTAGSHTIGFVGLNPVGGDNTALIDSVTMAAAATLGDSSFEVPALAAKSFQYSPSGAGWLFGAGTGVSSNGSAFTSRNPNAPDGSQVAFIQGGGASMSQSVYLEAGAYSLTLQAAQRAINKYAQEIEVLVDGAQVGTFTPNSIGYGWYQSSNFSVTTGMHTIGFVGLNPQGGDNTAFIDNLTIAAATSISDSSFEAPGLPAKTYQYSPNGMPWRFGAGTGISNNGTAFTSRNPNAPDGTQVAFIQGGGASMSQAIYLNAGAYSVSLQAAQRFTNKYPQEIEVLVDGAQVGTITPGSTGYGTYQTSNFLVTAGMHTLEFLGLNPQGGDNTAFVDTVSIAPELNSISDSSFELPGQAASSYQYSPNGSPWQFGIGSGISGNGSTFTTGNPNAPDGSQVAFIQQGGSVSQAVYFTAGTYTLSLQAAQRAANKYAQEIEVLVDGVAAGTITPTSASYGTYQSSSFTVTTGMHTIELLGLNPQGGDNTAFIDTVQIA
jgi:hypothetical protein